MQVQIEAILHTYVRTIIRTNFVCKIFVLFCCTKLSSIIIDVCYVNYYQALNNFHEKICHFEQNKLYVTSKNLQTMVYLQGRRYALEGVVLVLCHNSTILYPLLCSSLTATSPLIFLTSTHST